MNDCELNQYYSSLLIKYYNYILCSYYDRVARFGIKPLEEVGEIFGTKLHAVMDEEKTEEE